MKNEIKSFRDLIVWQRSIILVGNVYKYTKNFPAEELYGLTSQIRRSAVSIPSNIAEGYGRKSTGDYCRFLQYATGSLYELDTQLEISYNLNYFAKESFIYFSQECTEIGKMLNSLTSKIKISKKN